MGSTVVRDTVDPSTLLGQTVRVHLNLTRGEFVISLAGKVVAYVSDVELEGVTFKVSQAVRRRVLEKTGHREVHAWAFGTLAAVNTGAADLGPRRVSYNPFTGPSFTAAGEPVDSLERVTFTSSSRAGWTA